MIVIDASAVVEMLLARAPAAAIRNRCSRRGESLHAPHLLDVEVVQTMRRLSLLDRISDADAEQALFDYALLRVERYPLDPLLARIWDMRKNLTAYDANYVALADDLGAPLITCDKRLATAGARYAQIELF